MHSSRNHCSSRLPGGVCPGVVCPEEGVCTQGEMGCLPRGVSAWGDTPDTPRGQNDRQV